MDLPFKLYNFVKRVLNPKNANSNAERACQFFQGTHARAVCNVEERLDFLKCGLAQETEPHYPALLSALVREVERYTQEDLLELYNLIELAGSEGWPQPFIDALVGRFFTFLKTQATNYFQEMPQDEAHPAGAWPKIVYLTMWLNFTHAQNFEKIAALPQWYPDYPKEQVFIVDAVCNNKKALNRVAHAWQDAFNDFSRRAGETEPEVLNTWCWWSQTWLKPSWKKHLAEIERKNIIFNERDA